jgi:hypothetical protein
MMSVISSSENQGHHGNHGGFPVHVRGRARDAGFVPTDWMAQRELREEEASEERAAIQAEGNGEFGR